MHHGTCVHVLSHCMSRSCVPELISLACCTFAALFVQCQMVPTRTAKKPAAKTMAKAKAVLATVEHIRPGVKAGWWKTKRGKKSLQRVQEHRQLKEDQSTTLEGVAVAFAWYEGSVFLASVTVNFLATVRSGSKVEAARLCMFLLQFLILSIRTWSPSLSLKKTIGAGRETCTRMAILWHHVHRLDSEHEQRLKSLGQDLYLRALQEGDAMPSTGIGGQAAQDTTSSSSQNPVSQQWASPDRLAVHFAYVLVLQMHGGYYPQW